LQKQQIAAGQTPSIGYDPRTGAPTGQPVGAGMALGSSSGLFTILIIGAVIWMVAKK
jgi:anti-sigma-K factor RskA